MDINNFKNINHISDVMSRSYNYYDNQISSYKQRSYYDCNCLTFWAPLLDYMVPGIESFRFWVSTHGNVYDSKKQKYLSLNIHNKGYIQCHFPTPYSNIKTHVRKVHRLVMLAFYYFPECHLYEVNHKDGNKTNNFIGNLEWCTHSENTIHAINSGLKTIFGRSDLTVDLLDEDIPRIIELYKNGYTFQEIIDLFSKEDKHFGKVHISNILNGKNRQAYFNDLYHLRS